MGIRSPIINVMVSTAFKAAKHLRRDFNELEHLQVSRKGPADFVTNADLRAEDILFAELSRVRPSFGFLMEERGEIIGEDPTKRWIVDPLDGTTNFLHGLAHFAVSIALEEDGAITAGVIYDPLKEELFWVERGVGAFVNDRRIRVAGRTSLKDTLLATGIPWEGRSGHAEFLGQAEAFMGKIAGIRRFGAASLDLAYVAAGRYDGFWESDLKPWDMAAGILMVREANGLVTELDGGDNMLGSGRIVAANHDVHIEMLKTLRACQEKAEH